MIDALTQDIYIKILLLLDYKSILRLGMASKSWYVKANNNEVWKGVATQYIFNKYRVGLAKNSSIPDYYKRILKNTIIKEKIITLEDYSSSLRMRLDRSDITIVNHEPTNTPLNLPVVPLHATNMLNIGSYLQRLFFSSKKSPKKENIVNKEKNNRVELEEVQGKIYKLKCEYDVRIPCAQELNFI